MAISTCRSQFFPIPSADGLIGVPGFIRKHFFVRHLEYYLDRDCRIIPAPGSPIASRASQSFQLMRDLEHPHLLPVLDFDEYYLAYKPFHTTLATMLLQFPNFLWNNGAPTENSKIVARKMLEVLSYLSEKRINVEQGNVTPAYVSFEMINGRITDFRFILTSPRSCATGNLEYIPHITVHIQNSIILVISN